MADRTCSIDGCGATGELRRGWCSKHYNRWQRHGDPLAVSVIVGNDEARFWSKVDVGHPLGCWEWTGYRDANGYGTFFVKKVRGRTLKSFAHRWAYVYLMGPIPDGLQLDHLCRNRACVNPDHLEPVTPGENTRRGTHPAVLLFRAGVCKRGHPLSEAYVRPNVGPDKTGGRICRACAHERTPSPPA